MNDAFTQQITDEINRLGSISPARLAQILSAETQWLDEFETRISERLRRATDELTDYWQQQVDVQMREGLAALAQLQRETQALATSATDSASSAASGNGFPLLNTTRSLTRLLTRRLFSGNRSETSGEWETGRSRQESVQFRQSRGQLQAELSKELARGERYT